MVKNSAKVNEETDPTLALQRQKAENAALREELALLKEGADVRHPRFVGYSTEQVSSCVRTTIGGRNAQYFLATAHEGQSHRLHARRRPRRLLALAVSTVLFWPSCRLGSLVLPHRQCSSWAKLLQYVYEPLFACTSTYTWCSTQMSV